MARLLLLLKVYPTQFEECDMLTLTENAINAVKGLITETPDASGLRVMVSGGGCSGFQYGMGLEAQSQSDDTVISLEGLQVFVDQSSAPLLTGVVIDYVEDITGVGFRFENPNASATCGCGSSFTVKGDSPAPDKSSCGHRG
jgi:iron-sulfur cluster assembly protein